MDVISESQVLHILQAKIGAHSENLDVQQLMKGIRPPTHKTLKELQDHEIAEKELSKENLTCLDIIQIKENMITHKDLLEILIWKRRILNKRNGRDR